VEDKPMTSKRKKYTAQFKFRVAPEASRGHQTISQIASQSNLHPNLVSNWKKQLLKGGPDIFKTKANRQEQVQAAKEAELYEQIGRLKMELEWLKKKLPSSVEV
jgi:transposase-like protein